MRPSRAMIIPLLAAAIALAATFVSGTAGAGQLFRWVDENGKVHYGDRIPPQYAEGRREKLNEQGVVVDVQERERTEAERRAASRLSVMPRPPSALRRNVAATIATSRPPFRPCQK